MIRGARRKAVVCFLILGPLAAGPAACGDTTHPLLASAPRDAATLTSLNVKEGSRAVDPDRHLEVTARDGAAITGVRAVDALGRPLPGRLLGPDGARWRSSSPLAAGTRYTVRITTADNDGAPVSRTAAFATRSARGERLGIEFGPGSGTYGVGQPLTAELSRPVEEESRRAVVERALEVRSSPRAVEGSWHWVDDRNLHYRPRGYWPARTTVTVRSLLEGLHIRDGLRGGRAEPLRITIGDRVEAVADISAKRMTISRNGEVLRIVPVTTGKAGFRTREGVKVVLGKESFVRMRGTSIGIPAGSPESYDLPVHWAVRLTWSGEYVHAAPWSASSHGYANVSHGCTGMSTENARWFFRTVRPGDIVRHINGEGEPMPAFGNGFGDWNLSWEEWRQGSALPDASRAGDGADRSTPGRGAADSKAGAGGALEIPRLRLPAA